MTNPFKKGQTVYTLHRSMVDGKYTDKANKGRICGIDGPAVRMYWSSK